MSARRRWGSSRRFAIAAAGTLLALAAGGVAALLADRPAAGGVPTYVVTSGRFVRQVPAEGNLKAVESTSISLPPTLRQPMRIAWLADDGSRVEAGDEVVRFDATDIEKNLLDAKAERASAELKVGKERTTRGSTLANLERDAELAQLKLDNAREFKKKDELIFSRHEIIESEIDEELALEEQEHAAASRSSSETLSDADLELLSIERRQADLSIDRAEEGLAALVLSAPHEGVVVFRRDRRGELPRVGDTTWPGNPLAEIPDLGEMEAEVWVLEADAGGLAVGKPAAVVLEAHPGQTYRATVARVDSLAKPRVRGSPVQYFAVTLKLDETVAELMKPGQRVRAELLLDELEQAIGVPRQAVFDRDGQPIVYRRRGGGFEAVAVELGPVAMGRVAVVSGLRAGDEIALADPQRPPESRFGGAAEEGNGGALSGGPGGNGR